MYFGEGNRVDVVGNYMFVLVDLVLMSVEVLFEVVRYDFKLIYMFIKIFLDRL